jgi:hypothetical protein
VAGRLYRYIGPTEIKERASHALPGMRITSVVELDRWICSTGQEPDSAGTIAVTFVVDEEGFLRVADRRSEHIACSDGRPVLSAGEIFFRVSASGPEVVEVSNQSTGFCPEPASWPAVAAALDRLGIPHPGRFTREVIFRHCPVCGERNVVKDGWFICELCGADLPTDWNFGCPP